MFEIDHLDFIGNEAFDNLFGTLFGGCPTRRIVDDDGVESTRVYFPRRRRNPDANYDVSPNKQTTPEPTWRKEVRTNVEIPEWTQTPSKPVAKPVRGNADIPKWTETPSEPSPKPNIEREPKSILEMLEDGDKRLEKLLGDIIDKKLAERENANKQIEETPAPKKDPSVFIANRLTFLIQTLQPIVFDTSNIEATPNTMTIAVNEGKTFPKIDTIDELGFITSKINASPTVIQEIEDYLKGTGYTNIYCFPTTMEDKDGDDVFAVRFVVYPGNVMERKF